jgi:ATP-dependent DNA helicase RecG
MSHMLEIDNIGDLKNVRESVGLECKLAGGRDGQGALPDDFWPTYSAFANTHGGVVILGLREKHGKFVVEGIPNIAKVRKELFDTLNNRQKVSTNLLNDQHVRELTLEGKTVLCIEIPRATRKQCPVHLTTNPFGHTYRRLNDGDRLLPDDAIRRMIAEQITTHATHKFYRGSGWPTSTWIPSVPIEIYWPHFVPAIHG